MRCFEVLLTVTLRLAVVVCQNVDSDKFPSALLKAEHRGESCDCMEYWTCANSGGQPYSYCGLEESSVCCLLPLSQGQTKPRCGVKGFDSGQTGVAEPSEWPWHVAIVEEPGFYYVCGGSLIDESWILTAAHCVQPYSNHNTSRLKVRLGEHDVIASTESLPHEDRNVSKIVIHPGFDPNTLMSDIALVKLDTPARQRHHIDVVCVPETQTIGSQSSCFLTGWGKTSENGSYSHVLKEIPVPIWDHRLCEDSLSKEFGSRYQVSNSTLCAGAPGRDACDGDGGSPLVCQHEGQWYQHGIVSYGFGCGERGTPGIYTRVPFFYSWIRRTVLT